MHLCFVIPVYNERDTLEALTAQIVKHAAGHEVRIIFVDDGSTDGSGETLDSLAKKYDTVETIHFPENRGKSAALAEGFRAAEGDVVFTMDSDLQDDPVEIPAFLEKLAEGSDLVCGWKVNRQDPWHKTLPSKVYNGFVAVVFGLKLHDINCGYKAMTLPVAKSLELKHDYHRLIPVLAAKQGYTVSEIPVKHHRREYGHSKYGLARFWHGARDVFRLLISG
jgi:glycosyltransferase involved in cell wall biosynthesis